MPCVPVTSPLSAPVKLVEVVALPDKLAVIVPALKLPEALRSTIVLGVFLGVAALARTVAAATLAAVCPPTVLTTVAPCVPVTSPTKDPVKLVALPVKFAVIVPALKLPEASRFTIVLAVFAEVAALARTEPAATLAADCRRQCLRQSRFVCR